MGGPLNVDNVPKIMRKFWGHIRKSWGNAAYYMKIRRD